VGYQVSGNTFIDDTRSAIFNANTTIANNFTVQVTDRTVYVATGSPVVGTVAGFTSGGFNPPETNVIDKFLFSSTLTATDHGDLTTARRQQTGQNSETQGFVSGGYYAPAGTVDIIEKFDFASASNATDHGDLTQSGRRLSSGQSSSVSGYTSGGLAPPAVGPPAIVDTIDKFPFAAAGNASDVGDITTARRGVAGQSSEDNGYVTGGFVPPASFYNIIDKFPFASDVNATDIADMTRPRNNVSSNSSRTFGYVVGGYAPGHVDIIDKFPFAADTNATDVGNLVEGKYLAAGQNSKEFGYSSGGRDPFPQVRKDLLRVEV